MELHKQNSTLIRPGTKFSRIHIWCLFNKKLQLLQKWSFGVPLQVNILLHVLPCTFLPRWLLVAQILWLVGWMSGRLWLIIGSSCELLITLGVFLVLVANCFSTFPFRWVCTASWKISPKLPFVFLLLIIVFILMDVGLFIQTLKFIVSHIAYCMRRGADRFS